MLKCGKVVLVVSLWVFFIASASLPVKADVAKVDINTATIEQLQPLPGIGPALAQKIVDYRNAHGNFKCIEDIMNVPGIGEKKFEQIKDLITVTPPVTPPEKK